VEDILHYDHVMELFDQEVIREYMNYLVPEDCIVYLQTQENKKRDGLMQEHYYGTEYKTEKFTDEFLTYLREAAPKDGEVLDNPVKNLFVPTEELKQNKAEREDPDEPGKPTQITDASHETKSTIWFKKDDSFEQPFVWAHVKIETNHLGFPKD